MRAELKTLYSLKKKSLGGVYFPVLIRFLLSDFAFPSLSEVTVLKHLSSMYLCVPAAKPGRGDWVGGGLVYAIFTIKLSFGIICCLCKRFKSSLGDLNKWFVP